MIVMSIEIHLSEYTCVLQSS